eukprot:4029599-Pyramimonas_sp.AAC.2
MADPEGCARSGEQHRPIEVGRSMLNSHRSDEPVGCGDTEGTQRGASANFLRRLRREVRALQAKESRRDSLRSRARDKEGGRVNDCLSDRYPSEIADPRGIDRGRRGRKAHPRARVFADDRAAGCAAPAVISSRGEYEAHANRDSRKHRAMPPCRARGEDVVVNIRH